MQSEKLPTDLLQANERLRHIIASSPAMLFTVRFADDGEMQDISWLSENREGILGYSHKAESDNAWFFASIHPEDRDRIAQDLRELRQWGQVAHEYRIMHADGVFRWARCELRVICAEASGSVEAVGTLFDITEQKSAEEREARLREQLQQAQRIESVGRLAAGVAHDFNNLLTVINGYSEMALNELPHGTLLHECISEVLMSGKRAASLTRQLLILSRQQVIQPVELNLNDLIAELERMLSRIIGADIRLISRLEPSLGRVLADPNLMSQVMINLVVNARDAMPDGGTILIETENVVLSESYSHLDTRIKPGRYVRLTVSDTGTGMTEEVKSRIFEPFFTTKRAGQGTGLGLATAYGIITQGGGAISVHSELGHGSAFAIYLPLVDQRNAQKSEAAIAPMPSGTETILLVEDDEQLRKMGAFILRKCGYTVLEAGEPNQALLQAERHQQTIHLLLTDLVMPGSTGRELANRIRVARPSIKVIFMSGYSAPFIAERGLLDPGAAYVQKPFSPESLATAVRDALGPENPKAPFHSSRSTGAPSFIACSL